MSCCRMGLHHNPRPAVTQTVCSGLRWLHPSLGFDEDASFGKHTGLHTAPFCTFPGRGPRSDSWLTVTVAQGQCGRMSCVALQTVGSPGLTFLDPGNTCTHPYSPSPQARGRHRSALVTPSEIPGSSLRVRSGDALFKRECWSTRLISLTHNMGLSEVERSVLSLGETRGS